MLGIVYWADECDLSGTEGYCVRPFGLLTFLFRSLLKYKSYTEHQLDKTRNSIHNIIDKLINIQNKGSILSDAKENKDRVIRITENFATKILKDKQA